MQNQEVIIRNPMALNEDALAEVFTDHTSDQLEDEAILESTDFAARKVLSVNFYDCAGVFVRKHRAHVPTQDEWQAINYLCDEWDYGYEGGWVTE